MKLSRTRMLFVGMLVLSIIIFLQGKSFVPIACYFLIMTAIIEVMIVEIDQYKFKEYEIQNLKVEHMDWTHKELNQACDSNDTGSIRVNNKVIEAINELKKLFPEATSQSEKFREYKEFSEDLFTDRLLLFSFFAISEYFGENLSQASRIKNEEDVEVLLDITFGKVVEFFDFYYKYRQYSKAFKTSSFENFTHRVMGKDFETL